MRLKIGSLLVISAMLVSGVLGLITPVHGATSSLNITGPLLEPTISDGNFTIKGSFRSTAIVKKVQISVCYLKDSDCYAYLYDQKGAITRYEKLFTAELLMRRKVILLSCGVGLTGKRQKHLIARRFQEPVRFNKMLTT